MVDQTFKTFLDIDGKLTYADYTPECVIAGDTDSVYIDISKIFGVNEDPELVIKYGDTIGELVNDSFDEYVGELFNVPKDKRAIVETEREAISDKSVFFGKKKYVMHVINMEGKTVDKQKKMGVEIIKSDTPKVIQEFLQDIVDMLLEHRSYEDVKNYVDNFEIEYKQLPMIDIGRPTNIKTLNKYVDRYIQEESFKGFPYHAKASIIYNSLCSTNDVMIRAGDKIKITYVKDEAFGAIAVPADMEEHELPDFITSMEIDYKVMWSKVLKKLELYLAPIGYDKKSRQETLTNSLFIFD